MSPLISHTQQAHLGVTVRLADPGDSRALLRLATLDSASVPSGQVVLAESDGELMAAAPVAGGSAIADPFQRTAALVEVLELRATQLRAEMTAEENPTAWRSRLASRLRDSRPVPYLP